MKQHSTVTGDDNASTCGINGTKNPLAGQNGLIYTSSGDTDFAVLTFNYENKEGKENVQKLNTLRNTISSYLFEYLQGFHIPTYFISKRSETEMSVKKTQRIPLIIRIYNSANGQLTKRFGLKEGMNIEFPILEHYYTLNARGNSWVNEYHIYGLGILIPEEFKQMNRIATKVNAVLRGLCDRRQLSLPELCLTFGRFKGQMLLCGELSPATCHFLDASGENKNKRDRFALAQDDAVESLFELSDRLLVKA